MCERGLQESSSLAQPRHQLDKLTVVSPANTTNSRETTKMSAANAWNHVRKYSIIVLVLSILKWLTHSNISLIDMTLRSCFFSKKANTTVPNVVPCIIH